MNHGFRCGHTADIGQEMENSSEYGPIDHLKADPLPLLRALKSFIGAGTGS